MQFLERRGSEQLWKTPINIMCAVLSSGSAPGKEDTRNIQLMTISKLSSDALGTWLTHALRESTKWPSVPVHESKGTRGSTFPRLVVPIVANTCEDFENKMCRPRRPETVRGLSTWVEYHRRLEQDEQSPRRSDINSPRCCLSLVKLHRVTTS